MTNPGHVRRTIHLTIGGTDYSCAVTGIDSVPTVDEATSTTLCADGTVTDVGTPTYALAIDYVVDWAAGSFFRFLRAHAGETAAYTYEPDPVNAAGVVESGTVRIKAGNAGGSAGSFESGSVTLPVVGTPTITDPGADAPDPADVQGAAVT